MGLLKAHIRTGWGDPASQGGRLNVSPHHTAWSARIPTSLPFVA